MMDRIIERVENDPHWPEIMDAEHGGDLDDDATDTMVAAARRAADAASTACIVAYHRHRQDGPAPGAAPAAAGRPWR